MSIRRGVPSASTSRSSGPAGKPSGGPGMRLAGRDLVRACRRASAPAGSASGRAACSGSRPAHRSLPSSICKRCSARQVWKPLEWAEMPRIACMLTGRPIICCVAPAAGVGPGLVEHRRIGEGGLGELGGDAADGGGGDAGPRGAPHRARRPGRDSARPAAGRPAARAGRRAASTSPFRAGLASGSSAGRGALPVAVPDQRAGRRRRARTGRGRRRPGRRSPARARWCSGSEKSRSTLPARSSSWTSASTNRPSVPGVMPSHSSAIAE